ncbi:MAG: serine/threonine protein kinase [Phycisphaerales bacterium]|nr:serine/threonine protein kinase [Phycisphaerales bacterium]MCB9854558.1 serine/threonine protein kinase [Phycisphaerales bacterium]MCB9863213.1 serine/threonine protein kinase [Phycisphaerales bacterium]
MKTPFDPSSSAASADSQRRDVRIRRIVEQCMTRRAAGEVLSDDEIMSSHADLLPELREELSLLSMMERARQSALSSSAALDAGARAPDAGDVRQLLDVRGYSIQRELHRGGQGVVFEAEQRSTGRSVAIKVLHDLDAADLRVTARFEREARILAMIDHSNVVKVIDTGVVAGRRYIAMDLIHGMPWTQYECSGRQGLADSASPDHSGNRGTANVRLSLERFATICDAINAAHLRGVIHRDLKPGNILIDTEGRPHVLDFGLAKLTDIADAEVVSMTREGQFVGSLPWASPEQASGNAELLDVRSDIYSLGVVLYQVLTGHFPYEVNGAWRDVAQTIMDSPPVRPRTLRSDLDLDVEKIVMKCLAKPQEERYQSAGQLAEDVRRYLAGEPVAARGGGTIYILRRLARKHRVAVTVALSFFLLIVVAAITTTTLYQSQRIAAAKADDARKLADEARETAEEARHRAELEAEKATAVEAFLRGVLSGADPRRMGKDITVAELLDRASQSTEYFAVVKDKPLVEAAVRQAMGETYCGLGMAQMGEREFRAALELMLADNPGVSDDAIMTMHTLATSLWMQGKFSEAQEIIEKALAARNINDSTPIDSEQTAELLSLYNVILGAQGNYTNMVPIARKRLDYYARAFGKSDWRTVYAMNDFACALAEVGQFNDAADLHREAWGLARDAKGADDPITLQIAFNLINELIELRQLDDVGTMIHDVLEARRRTLPADHPAIIESLVQLAEYCGAKKDYACAREAAEEVLELQLNSLGADHWKTAAARVRLASVDVHDERFEDAESELQSAFESLKSSWCEHRQLAEAIGELLRSLYGKWGRPDELSRWESSIQAIDCGPASPNGE